MKIDIPVQGFWLPREETTAGLAARLKRHVSAASEIDPRFATWRRRGTRHRSKVPQFFSGNDPEQAIEDWFLEGAGYHSYNGRKTLSGHWILCSGAADTKDFYSSLQVMTKLHPVTGMRSGRVWHSIDFPDDEDVDQVAERALSLTTAIGSIWELSWAGCKAGNFSGVTPPSDRPYPRYLPGWIVYLGTAEARRVEQAKGTDNGDLPTKPTVRRLIPGIFNPRDHAHAAVAKRLGETLDVLNQADSERSLSTGIWTWW